MIQNISLLGRSWITIGMVSVFTHGMVSGEVRQSGEEARNMANKLSITGEYYQIVLCLFLAREI